MEKSYFSRIIDSIESNIDDSEDAEKIIKFFISHFVKRPGQHPSGTWQHRNREDKFPVLVN